MYFLILIALVYFSYLLGIFTLSLFKFSKSLHYRILQSIFTGYLTWVSLTAIFFTGGNTILALIPLIVLLWLMIFKVKINKHGNILKIIKTDSLELFKLMWFLLFIFTLFSIKHVLSDGIIEHDYLFYSNVAYTMQETGVEGILFGMYNSPEVHPYHYGDIWITVFISSIFKTNLYHTTIFLTIPFLLFMVYVSAVALIKEIGRLFFNNQNLNFTFLLGGLLIIISGVEYPLLNQYFEGTYGLIQWPKQSMIYVVFVSGIIFILRDQHKHAFLVIMLLLPLYLPTSFFILSATGIVILILLFKNFKKGWKYLLVYSLIIIGIASYYGLNSALSETTTSGSIGIPKFLEGLSSFPEQFAKKLIRYFLLYLPFILLFVLLFYNSDYSLFIRRLKENLQFKIIVVFLISGFVFSLFFSTAFSAVEQDYDQLFYNGVNPFLATLCFILITFFFYKTVALKDFQYVALKIGLVIFITLGITYQYIKHPRYWGNIELIQVEEDFYLQMDRKIENKDKIATFQYFKTKPGWNYRKYYYKLYPLVSRLANFKYNGNYMPECINVHEMDTVNKPKRQSLYNYSYFIHYMDSLRDYINPNLKPGEIQKLFLVEHDFDYVILPKSYNLPIEIIPLIKDSIVKSDGLRVYELEE